MTKKADKKEANFNPPLYVFGLDENGKPRGARFSEVRDDIVNAALDMKCWVVYPAPEDFVPLGMKLPVGRLYASGRAFIPNIRRDLYDKLFATKGKNAAFLQKAETDKTEGRHLIGCSLIAESGLCVADNVGASAELGQRRRRPHGVGPREPGRWLVGSGRRSTRRRSSDPSIPRLPKATNLRTPYQHYRPG